MNNEILEYNASQTGENQGICKTLMTVIENNLTKAESKMYHANPVWFIKDNPIVGYSVLKGSVQLLFWSGESFGENLTPVGKYKAAEARYTDANKIIVDDVIRWLNQSKDIQWDYKNLVKRNGVLERLK